MVYDGIKVLSGGHRRCSEPRPWVALDGRGAVISVPHCQSWPPPPSLKNLSICHISRGRPSARHALSCHSLPYCRTPSDAAVFTKKQWQQFVHDCITDQGICTKNVGVAFPSWSNHNSVLKSSASCCALNPTSSTLISSTYTQAKSPNPKSSPDKMSDQRAWFSHLKVHMKMAECQRACVTVFSPKNGNGSGTESFGDGSF